MAGLRATFDNAVSRHLTAAARLSAIRSLLRGNETITPDASSVAAENQLADRLSAAAAGLKDAAGFVRIGQARLHEASFPVHLPFTGIAHIGLSTDSRDPRVAALIRSILLQAMATAPAGQTRIVAVDSASVGATFAPLQGFVDARLMRAAATDFAGFDAALREAEEHVKARLRGEPGDTMILAIASAPHWREAELARVTALARSGAAAGLQLLVAGVADLPETFNITVEGQLRIGNGPQTPLGSRGGLAAPVDFDPALDEGYIRSETARIAERARAAAQLSFADLKPARLWSQDPAAGVTTIAGRDSQDVVTLSFDDNTPHWLIGGRTGGGKTVFLLDVLYGLAARYSPRDLALYLLDFKEGVSFTEFTPQESDPTYIPHARAVGVESDREYGVAILRELDAEMTRRSTMMKRAGVARYSQLSGPDRPPRIVCIVDEFQVLFDGNDSLARNAVRLLENLARKGRSYGVHLVLASQTTSGIEALYNKQESIFGQFPMRVALPGATSVLDPLNDAAQTLRTGEAVINTDGGVAGRDRRIRFPNAHNESQTLYQLRHEMWQARGDAAEPTVFYGYASVHIEDDTRYQALVPTARPDVLLGRAVDAGLGTASVELNVSPGRHLSILGADVTAAQVLHAATASLVRQRPHARFLIAPFAEPGVAEATAALAGDHGEIVTPDKYVTVLEELATADDTFLIGFGLDAANLEYAQRTHLTKVLRDGPGRGVHLLGWWRGLRRFTDDLSSNKEDVACSLILNIPGSELTGPFGGATQDWNPRPGRGLLIDRHANTTRLVVPFTQREAP